MGFSWEVAVVGLLVAAAGAWAVRALVRSLRKPGACSSCGSSGDCPVANAAGGSCATDANGESPRRRSVSLH